MTEIEAQGLKIGQRFTLRGTVYRRYDTHNFEACLVKAENPWLIYILGADEEKHTIIAVRPTTLVSVEET